MTTLAVDDDRVLVVRETHVDLTLFREDELTALGRFKIEKRRREWLLSRSAAKQLAATRGLDPRACTVARPRLLVHGDPSAWFVSISHSARYAGAMLDTKPCGIDVQVVRELSENAAHLFLTDEETRVMQRCSVAHRMLHFWCAKEAAFKQSQGRHETLKRVPLALVEEHGRGLVFDGVKTLAVGELVVAVTR